MANDRCTLLSLPPELRNRIYEFVLILQGPVEVCLSSRDPRRFGSPQRQPGLTRVNRQLREETLPIYYTQNTFRFDTKLITHNVSLQSTTKALGHFAPHCGLLRVLQFCMCSHRSYYRLNARAGEPGDRLLLVTNEPPATAGRCAANMVTLAVARRALNSHTQCYGDNTKLDVPTVYELLQAFSSYYRWRLPDWKIVS